MKDIFRRARDLAELVRKQEEVLIVTHIDADGITSGAIAASSLERIGVDYEIKFIKNIDENVVREIADENKFVWFTDLGSGTIDLIVRSGIKFIISDHHRPSGYSRFQLNPNEFGISGEYELSGSTTTYLISKNLGLNYDLIPIAVVGAVGDLQDLREGRLIGLNRMIVEEGIRFKLIDVKKDLRFFGKQTRPVFKMLEYTFDPFLPGISGNERGAIEFLRKIGIRLKDERWRRWIDLSMDEKRTIVSELVKLCIERNVPLEAIKRMVGETYILLREDEGTELRDAAEFSTLLNATARYGYCDIGLKICLGVCSEKNEGFERAYRKARNLLQKHRKNLSEGLKIVEKRIYELENIQYFHAGWDILDTIVGIVAGMSFSKVRMDKPIIAFAYTNEGVKVSARATQKLVDMGVNLAEAIRIACEKIGGSGGGHSIAAGAIIPKGSEDEFLKEIDRIIGKQLRREI